MQQDCVTFKEQVNVPLRHSIVSLCPLWDSVNGVSLSEGIMEQDTGTSHLEGEEMFLWSHCCILS